MSEKSRRLEVGTEEWLHQTGGRLTLREAVEVSAQGLSQAVRERLRRSRPDPGESAGQVARVAKARNELESVLGTQRERILQRQGQALLHHACRTFLLGAALLDDEGFSRIDCQAAAIAALAHDDGLVHPSARGQCFTVDSAAEVTRMMGREGESSEVVAVARAAVVSHFQPILPSRAGAEAQLIALGASADVMGFGLRRLDPGLLQDVWLEWPDLVFLVEVKSLLKGERRRAPRTRAGVLAISGMPYLLRSGRSSNKA